MSLMVKIRRDVYVRADASADPNRIELRGLPSQSSCATAITRAERPTCSGPEGGLDSPMLNSCVHSHA